MEPTVTDENRMQCQVCGQWGDGARLHPHLFCELILAGITDDPEAHLARYGFRYVGKEADRD